MPLPSTLLRTLSTLTLIAVLSGCSTLPRDGPTGSAVERGASNATTQGSYVIVDLDYAVSERIKAQPRQFLGSLAGGESDAPGGQIGPGDVLAVSIFDPGGSLFGAGGSTSTGVRSGSQTLPAVPVDSSGSVTIPFAGRVRVAGLSTTEAGTAIRQALVGKVGNPQVIVAMEQNSYNTVTVLGEVRQPGRAPLSSNANRIVDVIADRGGVPRPAEDVTVTIRRNGQVFSAPLSVVTSDFDENIRLARGDQINLVYTPRHFSTFGALGAVTQVDMLAGPLSLAGAISKVGGLDTNSANARSVLVFRFERPEVAQALGLTQPATLRGVPVVYRLNLEEAEGLFIANNFEIQADDIFYVPRSGSAELSKFFTLVQTFTRVIYDVSVTSTLSTN
ncbi:polysaccharide biosynthesis/export family protein [Brevundimonas goettingensis]|uniref:Polysaccharide export protein n=1 Tax=Brevundimonas goettingensis TaxID=2774190 RepID=A0A975C035_9CAUL|nr:polysaccharide biosynthesis/export family protein [Brevundimonas goettingensis]QTC91198.1 polysaccharide export protein [Brevundimonas goettingensis]